MSVAEQFPYRDKGKTTTPDPFSPPDSARSSGRSGSTSEESQHDR